MEQCSPMRIVTKDCLVLPPLNKERVYLATLDIYFRFQWKSRNTGVSRKTNYDNDLCKHKLVSGFFLSFFCGADFRNNVF